MTPKLFIDLVPRSAWFSNLRSELSKAEWDLVRKKTYRLAGYNCTSCGGRGPTHPVECHERWDFCESTSVQKLICVTALCPACHEATHYGLASVRGRERYAREQLLKVNKWAVHQLDEHIDDAMNIYQRRSRINWTLDASWLLDYVNLSEETKQKITSHIGVHQREINAWQENIKQPNKSVIESYLSLIS